MDRCRTGCQPVAEHRELILCLARENTRWGYGRIRVELLKLGVRCSHETIRRILRCQGLPPAPLRARTTWRQSRATRRRDPGNRLLHRPHGLVPAPVCAVLHRAGESPGSSGWLPSTLFTAVWVAQQARQLAWRISNGELRPRFLLRDQDAKFTQAFDEVFRSEGIEVIRVPFRTPVANSHAERWVGTARREVLDHTLIFGRRHLEYVLSEFVDLCR